MAYLFSLIWLGLAAAVALYIALSGRVSHGTKERKSQWVYQAWAIGCLPLSVRFTNGKVSKILAGKWVGE